MDRTIESERAPARGGFGGAIPDEETGDAAEEREFDRMYQMRKRRQVTRVPQGQVLATRAMVLVEEVEVDGEGRREREGDSGYTPVTAPSTVDRDPACCESSSVILYQVRVLITQGLTTKIAIPMGTHLFVVSLYW